MPDLAQFHDGGAQSAFVLCQRSWTLALYLIQTIPRQTALRLFQSGSFFAKLPALLRMIWTGDEHILGSSSTYSGVEGQHDGLDEQPSKRCRLSPDASTSVRLPGQVEPQRLNTGLYVIVCQFIGRLVGGGRLPHGTETASWYDKSTILLSSLAQAAEVVGLSLQLLLRLLEQSPTSNQKHALIKAIPRIIIIWRVNLNADNSHIHEGRAALFHQHCGFVSLGLLQWLKSSQPQMSGLQEAIDVLEQLVSLNVVLPLRSRLSAQTIADWTSNRTALTWSNIQSSVDTVENYLLTQPENSTIHPEVFRQVSPEYAALVLDIAIRALPSSNVRKRQREQMWLEELFAGLAYHACCKLPKMESAEQGVLKMADILEDDRLILSVLPLIHLLDVAIQYHLTISLPLLSYLTSVVLECSKPVPEWLILTRLIRLDCDIFIPNSGLRNAAGCLDELCDMMSQTGTVPDPTYRIIRDNITVPIIQAFGKARDMAGFFQIWKKGLEENMHQGSLAMISDNDNLTSSVWDDEQFLEAVTEAIKRYATPFLTRNILAETLPTLRSIRHRVGSTLDVFAQISILERCIAARAEDFLQQHLILEELKEAVLGALESQSTYQSQRWRLWSLLRCAAVHLPYFELDAGLLQVRSKVMFVQITAIEQLANRDILYVRTSGLREAVECFHVLVTSVAQEVSQKALLTEVSNLIMLITAHNDSLIHAASREADCLWDGRRRTLVGISQVVDACIGMLLQNPEVFVLMPTLLGDLVKQLVRRTSQVSLPTEGLANECAKVLRVILTTDKLLCDPALYQQLLKSVFHTAMHFGKCELVEHLLRGVNVQPLKREQLGGFCDEIMIRIRDNKTDESSKELSSALLLLEHFVRVAPVSVGSPKHWNQLLDLLDMIDHKVQQSGALDFTNALTSLIHIFKVNWDRTIAFREPTKVRELLLVVIEWCKKHLSINHATHTTGPSLTIVGELVENFRENGHVMSASETGMEDVQRQFLQTIRQQAKELVKDGPFDRKMCHCVQSFTKCRDVGQDDDESQIVVQSLRHTFALQEKALLEPGPDDGLQYAARIASLQLRYLQRPETAISVKNRLSDMITHALSKEDLSPSRPITASDLLIRARVATEVVEQIPQESYVEAFTIIQEDEAKPASSQASVYVAAALLNGIEPSMLEEQPTLASRVQYYATLRFVLESNNGQDLCIGLEMCRFVLTHLSGAVNQAAIDELQAALAVLTSCEARSAHSVTPELSTAVFDRICTIIAVLLGRFRSRLQSRYHLLMPVLQNLLHCLYYQGSTAAATQPMQTHQQLQFIGSLPKWISSSSSHLPPTSAMNYARLLTSICDPTASAVVTTKKRQASTRLNDETKKARSIAGQYMQYLVMEYARCTLDGQISPESKQKLMPGMYAILDCMNADLMRAMNTAMDANSRAVFKSLYDDWNKFGRWTSD